MTIENVVFETPQLDTRELLEAVRREGVKVEGILLQDFVVTFDWDGSKWEFRAPKDFAFAPSIPWFLQSITSATGPSRWAAVLHDYGYENHSLPRRVLDELYVAVMNSAEAGLWDRGSSWLGIRLGGWWPWSEHEGETTLVGLTRIGESHG